MKVYLTPTHVVRWLHGRRIATQDVTPSPFRGNRANEIQKSWQQAGGAFQGPPLDDYMTDGEVAYTKCVWDTLPGDTTFCDALRRIRADDITDYQPEETADGWTWQPIGQDIDPEAHHWHTIEDGLAHRTNQQEK